MPKINVLAAEGKATRPPRTRALARPVPVPVVVPANTDELKDHFIMVDGVRCAGRHRIIDFFDCAQNLGDREAIEEMLLKAVEVCGATLLHIHLHKFEEGGGISGVAVLAESHISIHTWPEKGYVALDVFMCGDAVPKKADDVLKLTFAPQRCVIGEHKRGVV